MAKIYAPPANIPIPAFDDYLVDGHYDFEHAQRLDRECLDAIAAAARATNNGDLVGEIYSHPVADGYATYVVWSQRPLALVHVPLGDAYALPEPHERGLRVADIRAAVKSAKTLAEIFGATS